MIPEAPDPQVRQGVGIHRTPNVSQQRSSLNPYHRVRVRILVRIHSILRLFHRPSSTLSSQRQWAPCWRCSFRQHASSLNPIPTVQHVEIEKSLQNPFHLYSLRRSLLLLSRQLLCCLQFDTMEVSPMQVVVLLVLAVALQAHGQCQCYPGSIFCYYCLPEILIYYIFG